jgi:hypothetical protein
MLEAAKIIGLTWVAVILTYGIVTIVLVLIQGAFRLVKRTSPKAKGPPAKTARRRASRPNASILMPL